MTQELNPFSGVRFQVIEGVAPQRTADGSILISIGTLTVQQDPTENTALTQKVQGISKCRLYSGLLVGLGLPAIGGIILACKHTELGLSAGITLMVLTTCVGFWGGLGISVGGESEESEDKDLSNVV